MSRAALENPFSNYPLLTVPEVAIRLKMSERSVWRLIANKEIQVLRFGRCTRITEEALQRFIDRHRS
jgi:excisionase family DNA binding protein